MVVDTHHKVDEVKTKLTHKTIIYLHICVSIKTGCIRRSQLVLPGEPDFTREELSPLFVDVTATASAQNISSAVVFWDDCHKENDDSYY